MSQVPDPADDGDDVLAAEYVLGVLPLDERLAVESRLRTDAGLAARVEAWTGHLAGLNAEFAPVPAPDLLPRIEARLFPAPAKPARRALWWLLAPIAALVVAVALMLSPPEPRLLARLDMPDHSVTYEVHHDGRDMTVTRVAGGVAPAGQVHELWIIAPDAAPVSLGLLEAGPLSLAYPDPPTGWTLAVSLEPAGGSPTGLPTGPVLMAAEIGI